MSAITLTRSNGVNIIWESKVQTFDHRIIVLEKIFFWFRKFVNESYEKTKTQQGISPYLNTSECF